MRFQDILSIVANLAAILTAVIASLFYVRFVWAERSRRKALEAYLKAERLIRIDAGKRTVPHLMAYLGMTEAEVLQAAFQSKKVECSPGQDEQGRAARLYFRYSAEDPTKADRL